MITTAIDTKLRFRPVVTGDAQLLRRMLEDVPSRTCDYTVGGILMWTDYFHYELAVADDTLFIKGVAENDLTRPAFSLPLSGRLRMAQSVELLADYCRSLGLDELTLSAVPADAMGTLTAVAPCSVEELTDWSDYVYDAAALATLTGKDFSKKRNHVNRFMADNPGARLVALDRSTLPDARALCDRIHPPVDDCYVTAAAEIEQVRHVLSDYDAYPFEGALLVSPTAGPVAFTVGEVRGDTLYVHIEKMLHDVSGAGETINKLFAASMAARYPIRYINREEDVGDPGLRRAKLSYRPVEQIAKYNVTFTL